MFNHSNKADIFYQCLRDIPFFHRICPCRKKAGSQRAVFIKKIFYRLPLKRPSSLRDFASSLYWLQHPIIFYYGTSSPLKTWLFGTTTSNYWSLNKLFNRTCQFSLALQYIKSMIEIRYLISFFALSNQIENLRYPYML